MAKPKQRVHREWFRAVSLGGRKTCPCCGEKLDGGDIWTWGQYVRAKFRAIKHFCEKCWPQIRDELNEHTGGCGCTVELVGKGCSLPTWLTLTCPVATPAEEVAA